MTSAWNIADADEDADVKIHADPDAELRYTSSQEQLSKRCRGCKAEMQAEINQ